MPVNRSDQLISVTELRDVLAQAPSSLRLMDCRFSLDDPAYGHAAWLAGHLPGALHADLNRELSAPVVPGVTGRHPLPEASAFCHCLQDWGIDAQSRVVLYDDGPGAFAARLWWLLHWVGIRDVRLLDGGLTAWKAIDGPMTTSVAVRPRSAFTATPDSSLIASASDVLSELSMARSVLIDARGRPRFRGEVEPIDPVAGHIPGAKCFPFDENLTPNGQFRSAEELHQRFATLPDQPLLSSCGSGVTACHNVFALALAGRQDVRLYAGSWSEWITDASRPIALGD